MTSCCQEKKDPSPSACGCQEAPSGWNPNVPKIRDDTSACCSGAQTLKLDSPHEKPGYRLWGFVKDFLPAPASPVPQVRSQMSHEDRRGTLFARLGVGRDNYCITPGLYAIGTPDAQSPVMVTANYKLSFDVLRSHLAGISAWILVVNTRGINVWCAAGKGTFSTQEVAYRVQADRLADVVTHRRLILPQLSATGVSAHQVKSLCGFEIVWGPVHAKHIKEFLDKQMNATPEMRKVTFTLRERVELIPVELNQLGKPTLYLIPALFLLSGVGQGIFSISTAVSRGTTALMAYILAIAAGAVLAPALLPWLPGRALAIKGAVMGAAAGTMLSAFFAGQLAWLGMLALTLFIMAVSSYLTMNFTGSTPYTSPTGVEKEMRKAIPAQAFGALAAVALWVVAGFMGS
ncbi:MAG: mercury methylation corrinoid protein HgcA [Desulfobacterales bacterium]